MTKSVTGEATGDCVTYYGALERNKKVSWAGYIPNGSLWAQNRQYGTCAGTIYTLDTNITVWEGRYMFCPNN